MNQDFQFLSKFLDFAEPITNKYKSIMLLQKCKTISNQSLKKILLKTGLQGSFEKIGLCVLQGKLINLSL